MEDLIRGIENDIELYQDLINMHKADLETETEDRLKGFHKAYIKSLELVIGRLKDKLKLVDVI